MSVVPFDRFRNYFDDTITTLMGRLTKALAKRFRETNPRSSVRSSPSGFYMQPDWASGMPAGYARSRLLASFRLIPLGLAKPKASEVLQGHDKEAAEKSNSRAPSAVCVSARTLRKFSLDFPLIS